MVRRPSPGVTLRGPFSSIFRFCRDALAQASSFPANWDFYTVLIVIMDTALLPRCDGRPLLLPATVEDLPHVDRRDFFTNPMMHSDSFGNDRIKCTQQVRRMPRGGMSDP
jgi:hypothetical protein